MDQPPNAKPESAPADFVQRGKILIVRRQFLEAVKVCRLGLLASPTTVEGRLVLGLALMALGRHEEVLAEMSAALEVEVDNPMAHLLKGEALFHKREYEKAEEVLLAARALDPRNDKVGRLLDAVEHKLAELSNVRPVEGQETITRVYPAKGSDKRPSGEFREELSIYEDDGEPTGVEDLPPAGFDEQPAAAAASPPPELTPSAPPELTPPPAHGSAPPAQHQPAVPPRRTADADLTGDEDYEFSTAMWLPPKKRPGGLTNGGWDEASFTDEATDVGSLDDGLDFGDPRGATSADDLLDDEQVSDTDAEAAQGGEADVDQYLAALAADRPANEALFGESREAPSSGAWPSLDDEEAQREDSWRGASGADDGGWEGDETEADDPLEDESREERWQIAPEQLPPSGHLPMAAGGHTPAAERHDVLVPEHTGPPELTPASSDGPSWTPPPRDPGEATAALDIERDEIPQKLPSIAPPDDESAEQRLVTPAPERAEAAAPPRSVASDAGPAEPEHGIASFQSGELTVDAPRVIVEPPADDAADAGSAADLLRSARAAARGEQRPPTGLFDQGSDADLIASSLHSTSDLPEVSVEMMPRSMPPLPDDADLSRDSIPLPAAGGDLEHRPSPSDPAESGPMTRVKVSAPPARTPDRSIDFSAGGALDARRGPAETGDLPTGAVGAPRRQLDEMSVEAAPPADLDALDGLDDDLAHDRSADYAGDPPVAYHPPPADLDDPPLEERGFGSDRSRDEHDQRGGASFDDPYSDDLVASHEPYEPGERDDVGRRGGFGGEAHGDPRQDAPYGAEADPYGGAEADPYVGAEADPYVGAEADPYVGAEADPYGGAGADPYGDAGADPYGDAGADPHGDAGADPHVGAGADPYGGAGADPYGGAEADPYVGAEADPYDPRGQARGDEAGHYAQGGREQDQQPGSEPYDPYADADPYAEDDPYRRADVPGPGAYQAGGHAEPAAFAPSLDDLGLDGSPDDPQPSPNAGLAQRFNQRARTEYIDEPDQGQEVSAGDGLLEQMTGAPVGAKRPSARPMRSMGGGAPVVDQRHGDGFTRRPSARRPATRSTAFLTLLLGEPGSKRWVFLLAGSIGVLALAVGVGLLVRYLRVNDEIEEKRQAALVRLRQGNLDDYDNARQIYATIVGRRAGDVEARAMLARINAAIPIEFGTPIPASERAVPAGGTNDTVAENRRAAEIYNALIKGDLPGAADLAFKGRDALPRSALLLYLEGRVHLLRGKPMPAVTYLSRARELDAKQVNVLRFLAEAQIAEGKVSEADNSLRAALALNADHVGSLISQARLRLQQRQDLAQVEAGLRSVVGGNRLASRGQRGWAFLLLARLALVRGQVKPANDFVRQAKASEPVADPAFFDYLAGVLIDCYKLGEAERAAIRSERMMPGRPHPKYRKAQIYLRHGRPRDALQALRKSKGLSQSSLLKARIHLKLGEVALARKEVEAALRRVPDHMEAKVVKAEVLAVEGAEAEAESLLRPLLQKHPKQARLITALGRIHLARGQPAEARRQFEQALRLDRHAVDARLLLADAYLAEGNHKAAHQELVTTTRNNAWHVGARQRLAALDYDRWDLRQARTDLTSVLKRAPGNRAARLALVRVLTGLREYGLAGRELERLSGASAQLSLARGRLALARGKATAATIKLQAATQQAPKDPEAWTLLIRAHLYESVTVAARTARALARQMAEKLPKHPESFAAAGWIEWTTGKSGAALRHLRRAVRALEQEPQPPRVESAIRVLYGRAYHDSDRLDAAIEQFDKAREVCPKCPDPLHRKALTLDDKGKGPKAIALLKRAMALDPKNPNIYFDLAKVYENNNSASQAVAMYKRYLTFNPPHELARIARQAIRGLR